MEIVSATRRAQARARRGRLVLLVALPLATAPPLLAQPSPPSTLRIGVEHRTRLERLGTDFRATPTDDLTAWALRTLVALELGPPSTHLAVEIQDSRVYADDDAPLETTHVNALEVLTAYAALSASDVLSPGDRTSLRLGRLTLDRGSRRLVARNNFRNTINAFTGLDAGWETPTRSLRAFAALPVLRRPAGAEALADNRVRLDEQSIDALFWGAHFQVAAGGAARVEAYVVGLHERDGRAPSAHRSLVTPGVRVFRPSAPGRLDFEVEAMLQVGTSRASAAPSDERDLTHRAFSAHASAGYRFPVAGSPRLVLRYDHASGDRNPDDGRNGRFDPLFGARAFELNPTGFYGAFARSNIRSPGGRVEAAPHARLDVMAAYRLFWLASERDAWTTAGLRDATGASGAFVGRQLEWRARFQVVPSWVTIDVGGAALERGRFAREAEGGRGATATYAYAQVTVSRSRR